MVILIACPEPVYEVECDPGSRELLHKKTDYVSIACSCQARIYKRRTKVCKLVFEVEVILAFFSKYHYLSKNQSFKKVEEKESFRFQLNSR